MSRCQHTWPTFPGKYVQCHRRATRGDYCGWHSDEAAKRKREKAAKREALKAERDRLRDDIRAMEIEAINFACEHLEDFGPQWNAANKKEIELSQRIRNV